MVKIGDIELGNFPILLAPMEDVSDDSNMTAPPAQKHHKGKVHPKGAQPAAQPREGISSERRGMEYEIPGRTTDGGLHKDDGFFLLSF